MDRKAGESGEGETGRVVVSEGGSGSKREEEGERGGALEFWKREEVGEGAVVRVGVDG